jgi:ABC-type dipeptide/oligopeptide/nickel transport system ATPase component
MLLSVQNLSVKVQTHTLDRYLLQDINFQLDKKTILALVGGSGSGKTTTGLAILRLLDAELRTTSGAIHFNGQELLNLSPVRMRQIRGKEISMVFQEPLHAFNPVFRIGYQIEEVLRYHTDLTVRQREARIGELLNIVGIAEPQRVSRSYPHQLSGGMRQRAMIAQAIAAQPKLIIADEPTSNLDVTLQAKVMELFRKLRDELDLAMILITHDLGLVQHLSDEVVVMTDGRVVEEGKTAQVLNDPQHLYTKKLLAAVTV